MRLLSALRLGCLPALVHSLASSDTPQDADPPQSGYLPSHNIDPTKLNAWQLSWQNTYTQAEAFYAKPLVYTPLGTAKELVIVVSNFNVIRVLDGATGAVISTRTLDPPFVASDGMCGDVPNFVGITGTPYIDPNTDIMYLYSKGYSNGRAGPQGAINGQYKMYAVKLPDLTDISGFPIGLNGHNANNDPTRYFISGTVLQRVSLVSIGNSIITGFGGACDNFNYTGMLVSVSKTSGVGITNMQAMVASPGAPSPQPLDIMQQTGGKAAIWQSGLALATDLNKNRVFVVTGNAVGSGVNKGAAGVPANGKVPISTLENAVANFAVDPSTGKLTQQDYFEPYNYDQLNGGDRDVSSSGVTLLDSNPFSGGGVTRVAICGSKAGVLYVMDAENLGGFKNGPGGTDGILQTMTFNTPFFNGVASYPLEGGFVYICPTGGPLMAYKMTADGAGRPQFVKVASTAMNFACTGSPVVTTLNGQAGTGVVWLADVNQGLVAYNAVPVNGVLQPIVLPQTGRLTKFHRPVFGNNRAYVTRENMVIAVGGSPGGVSTISTSKSTSTTSSKTSSSKPATVASTVVSTTSSKSTSHSSTSKSTTSSTSRSSSSSKSTTLTTSTTSKSTKTTSTSTTSSTSKSTKTTSTSTTSSTSKSTKSTTSSTKSTTSTKSTKTTSTSTTSSTSKSTKSTTSSTKSTTSKSTKSTSTATTSKSTSISSSLKSTKSSTSSKISSTTSPARSASTSTLKTSTTTLPRTTTSVSTSRTKSSTKTTTTHSSRTHKTHSSHVKSTSKSARTTSKSPTSRTQATAGEFTGTSVTQPTPSQTLDPNQPPTVGAFDYIGCYADLVQNIRTLQGQQYFDNAMTLEACANLCNEYNYFGTEYGRECYCGGTIFEQAFRTPEKDCHTPCSGNPAESCGTGFRLSMYAKSRPSSASTGPIHVSKIGDTWSRLGCYTEGTGTRALAKAALASDSMTVEKCASYCNGWAFAGVEYGRECYCGNDLMGGSAIATDSDCNMLCAGSAAEYCGGPNRLDMYSKAA